MIEGSQQDKTSKTLEASWPSQHKPRNLRMGFNALSAEKTAQ